MASVVLAVLAVICALMMIVCVAVIVIILTVLSPIISKNSKSFLQLSEVMLFLFLVRVVVAILGDCNLMFNKIWRQLGDLWYWIRCHTFIKYHLIDIRSNDFPYHYGWIDADRAILLACFAILVKFVEKEDPRIGLYTLDDYAVDEWSRKMLEEQLERGKEVRAIYDWWTRDRCIEHKANQARRSDMNLFYKREKYLDDKDNEMLGRLLKVRESLWT